jgi:tRNA pseudouridine55 synthase
MNGIISVIKPPGMTSHDVVSYIRKVAGIKKVGHTGTLDPGATGVLPVCIGKATKVVDFIMNDKKTYICELTLGNSTDTYDKYGQFKYEIDKDLSDISEASILEVLNSFKGEIQQKPPIYSAIKLNGRRAYDMARNGEQFDIPSRVVTIYSIKPVRIDNNKIMLEITCSKGTYIRSICNDIGEMLGCSAYMSFLIRTATGNFNLSNSYTLEEICKDNINHLMIGADYCLDFDSVYVPLKYKTNILNGNSISCKNNKNNNTGYLVKIYLENNDFIGIGNIENDVLNVAKLII